jgi:hypothetical protein
MKPRWQSVWTLVDLEVRRFFSSAWNLRIVVLVAPAIWLALWEHIPSPFVPVFAAIFIGLEPQYCNIFYRSPNEFEALSLFPVSWTAVVLAKNLATILITLVCLPIVGVVVLYFYPDVVPADHFWKAGLYFASVIFPLLHFGNLQSVQHPRRHPGWRMDDLGGAFIIGAAVLVLSIPYVLSVEVAEAPLVALLYSGAGGYFWLRHAIRETARRVEDARSTLCTAE